MKTLNISALTAGFTALTVFACGSVWAQQLKTLTPDQIQSLSSASTSIPGARHWPIVSHDGGQVTATKIWLPAHTDLPPHGKFGVGTAGAVLVLSDGLELAMGSKFDASKLQAVPQGSLVLLTPGHDTHYGRTGEQPVELLMIRSLDGDFGALIEPKQ